MRFVNVPIIDYALESLSLGGVEETFLFCCTHVDRIKDHIRFVHRFSLLVGVLMLDILVRELNKKQDGQLQ